jgi:hypothetical protein
MSGNNGASGAVAAVAAASTAVAQEWRETMRLLRSDDNHRWIDSPARWIRLAGCESEDGLYLEFAKRFTATPEGTGDVVLEISAVSRYEVAINGETIAAGPAAGSAALRFYHRYAVPRDCLRPVRAQTCSPCFSSRRPERNHRAGLHLWRAGTAGASVGGRSVYRRHRRNVVRAPLTGVFPRGADGERLGRVQGVLSRREP